MRFSRLPLKYGVFFIFLLTSLLLGMQKRPDPPPTATGLSGTVEWVYDGDTLKVAGIGKVRLLGIDTLEHEDSSRDRGFTRLGVPAKNLRPMAKAALQHNIALVKNRTVRLATEEEERDRYGRLLAYVYLEDGTQLNRLLLEKGLAVVYRRFSFAHKQDFLQAEKTARQAERGLWAP